MSILFKITIFTLLFHKVLLFMLNENELAIVTGLSKEKNINHFVFVQNNFSLTSERFLKSTTSATIFNHDQLLDFLHGQDECFFNVIFVLKEKSLLVIEELLNKVKQLKLLHKISRHLWLAFVDDRRLIENDNSNLPFRYDCEFIIVEKNNETAYELTEIYNTNDYFFQLPFGTWDHGFGLKISDAYVSTRRRDLNQSVIPLVTYEFKKVTPEMNEDPLWQLPEEKLYDISRIMNFELKNVLQPIDVDMYQKVVKKEMKNYYFRSEAILLLADVTLEKTSNPLFKMAVRWYIKYPSFNLRPDFYLQPFERSVWCVILMFIIIGTIFVSLKRRYVTDVEKRSITDDAFLVLEYLCNQNGGNETEKIALRILGLTCSLLSFVVLAVFGAVVTSYVSAKIFDVPFVDFQTFEQNGKYRLLCQNYVSFMLPDDAFSNEIKLIVSFDENEQLEQICYEKLAFAEMDTEHFRSNIPCPIYQIEKPIGYAWTVIALSPNNPFRKAINYHIIRFYESGLHNRALKMVEPISHNDIKEEFKSIEIEQIWQMLLIILTGNILATLVVSAECLIKYCKYSKQ